jgi:hypothetical protein
MRGKSRFVLIMSVAGGLSLTLNANAAVFTDNFDSYSAGALGGQGAWTGAQPGRIDVVAGGGVGGTNGVQITGLGLSGGNLLTQQTIPAVTGNLITITFNVKGGTQGSALTMWNIYFKDASNNDMARVYLGSGIIRGRTAVAPVITGDTALSANGLWDTVKVVVDTVAKTCSYSLSLNGGPFNPFAGTSTLGYAGGGTQIEKIVWEATQGTSSGVDGLVISFDNLSLVPEPTTLGLLALGMMGFVSRRKVTT